MLSIGSISQSTISLNIASLPHYNTNEFRDLPANHAGEGVLANGDVFFTADALLTSSDTSLVQSASGNSFVQGDPLAGAIGTDRALTAIGWGDRLTGGVTRSYLENIEASEANPATNSGDGTYDGFRISTAELNAAISYLNPTGESTASTSSISISA